MNKERKYIVRRTVRLGAGASGQIYPTNTVIGPGHGHYDQAAFESGFPNGAVDVLEGEPQVGPSTAVAPPPSTRKKTPESAVEEDAPPEPDDEPVGAGKKKK